MSNVIEFQEYEPIIRHKEIDLIQSVINRMADNQLKVKGFCITILGFLLYAFKGYFSNNQLLLSSIIIISSCCFLDIKYLETEKLYRMWFDFLLDRRSETKQWLYVLNPKSIKFILKDQTIIERKGYDPDCITSDAKKSWSLILYLSLLCIVCIFYLPTFLAASSIH